MSDVWILEEVTAVVSGKKTKINISKPRKRLPRKEANEVADKDWLKGQVGALKQARAKGRNVSIPLTKSGSCLRAGGGFVQLEESRLILIQRDFDAPSRPGVFCRQAGVFDNEEGELFLTFMTETDEVIRIFRSPSTYRQQLLIPSLPSLPREQSSNSKMVFPQAELEIAHFKAVESLGLSVDSCRRIDAYLMPTRNLAAIYIEGLQLPFFRMNFCFEIDTSSIEFTRIMGVKPVSFIRYYDGESIVMNDKKTPLNREIHRIDIHTGEDEVWQSGKIIRITDIEEEVAKIDLNKTGGMVATEKVKEAIRSLPVKTEGLDPLLT